MHNEHGLAELRHLTDKLEFTETFFEAFLRQAPFVMWLKDYSSGEGRMVFISDKYADIFDVDDVQYVGKRDVDIWPPHIAEMFKRQDLEVIRTEKPVLMAEETPMANKTEWNSCMIIKFPIKDCSGHVIAVGGIAWPEDGRG